jgi:putative mRNA 3-end processing factor
MISSGALGLDKTDDGLDLRALDLTLDPLRPTTTAFVSHIHAALAGASAASRLYASAETVALRRALAPEDAASWVPIDWGAGVELPIAARFGGGTARLTLARAGHVLGAAQLVVDHPGGRLVYTGDWSAERDGTHEPGERIACDELVVTTTFALPIFRFDPWAQTVEALLAWCAKQLTEGVRPIVVAQSPGPAQAIARALTSRGLEVEAEDSVLRACAAYEAVGCPVGPVRAPAAKRAPDAVYLTPPSARAGTLRGRSAVAYASGWASLDAAVDQKRADAAFTLADHADGDALVGLVAASGAKRVHVTRGDALAFARVLQARGQPAEPIDLPAIDDRNAS